MVTTNGLPLAHFIIDLIKMQKAKGVTLLVTILLGVLCPFFVYSSGSQIVINEVVYDPEGADSDYEWIELYNPTNNNIDLAGWKIEAGGSSFQEVITIPTENSVILSPAGYYLIGEMEVGEADLNVAHLGFQNGGSATDGIRILDNGGNAIDTLLYDEPNSSNLPNDSGNPGENFAIDVSAGSSLGRDGTGTDTDNCAADFQEYTASTPGEANQSAPPQSYSGDIVINEFLPNPEGTDSDGEFIELKNVGSQPENLAGWIVSDASQTNYVIDPADFDSTQMAAGGIFLIDRSISGIALNNSGGDQVELYQPDGALLDKIEYGDLASEGESYARGMSGNFSWTTTSTPGAENLFTLPNQPPVANAGSNIQAIVNKEIVFDGSDSYDPDGDQLNYYWDFGDNSFAEEITPTHSYSTSGTYLVSLTVDDGIWEDSDSITVTVQADSTIPGDTAGSIIINEILPNPEGSDSEGEFIELKNIGSNPVNVAGWQLGDSSSARYTISNEDIKLTSIEAGKLLVIYREASGIALNNSGGDQAALYYPNEEEGCLVEYSSPIPEGKSYSLLASGEWVWASPTPDEENILINGNNPPVAKIESVTEARIGMELTFDASDSSDLDGDSLEYYWDFGDGNQEAGVEVGHSYIEVGSYTVVLQVVDFWGATSETSLIVTISDYDYSDQVLLNEIMANVTGSDSEGEWIEIVNLEEREVNLLGWQLTDLKDVYVIEQDFLIGSQDYLLIPRTDSGITLNNAGDTVYLLNP